MISLSARHKFLSFAIPSVIFLFSYYYFDTKPRTLSVNEVPIGFWSWRTKVPTAETIDKAASVANARVLFQRAGQFDIVDGKIVRIRPAIGQLKSGLETHLVYNATRKFLGDFESLDTREIAAKISEVYLSDVEKGSAEGLTVNGLQLDFDIPTRLLPKYTELLVFLRQTLPTATRLSITGLPTWSTSSDINAVLATVDFWIPQLYGSIIPEHIDELIPISSASQVKRYVTLARQLQKPYYAGLSAYGYAILYDKNGSLVVLRGDIDPAEAARYDDLQLIDQQTYSNEASGERRYVYRARGAVVLDDLIIGKGELLVLDVPSSASLRSNARTVREYGGDLLKGICIFRLPADGDPSAMALDEIASAVADKPTTVRTQLQLISNKEHRLELTATSLGTASSVMAPNAVTVDLAISPGSITNADAASGFTSIETLCGMVNDSLEPCNPKRGNVIRLGITSWKPGDSAIASFSTTDSIPDPISVLVTTHVDDGRTTREPFELRIEANAK
jgi:hypothetical protein